MDIHILITGAITVALMSISFPWLNMPGILDCDFIIHTALSFVLCTCSSRYHQCLLLLYYTEQIICISEGLCGYWLLNCVLHL